MLRSRRAEFMNEIVKLCVKSVLEQKRELWIFFSLSKVEREEEKYSKSFLPSVASSAELRNVSIYSAAKGANLFLWQSNIENNW